MAGADIQRVLKEQYGFLTRSIQAFSDGYHAEALRLATTIRVLVHDTDRSKALLKQLTPDYLNLSIKDIVSAPSATGPKVFMKVAVPISMTIEKGVQRVQPNTNMSDPNFQLVTLDNWWRKEILIIPTDSERVIYTRRQIVLTLANKEGGAHVDTNLPAHYENFVTDSPIKFAVNGIQSDSVHLSRFSTVSSAAAMVECLERNFPDALR